MLNSNDLDSLKEISALAEAGNHQQALSCLQQYLVHHPDDVQALNDTGAVLHCLGRTDEAINYLLKSNSLQPRNPQIIWNLVEAYLAAGRPNDASAFFDDMQRLKIISADVINRCANVFLQQGDKIGAINMLLKSLAFSPGQQVLMQMIDVIRQKTAKVAVFCGADGKNFFDDIAEYLKQRFEVRFFEGDNPQQLYELMQWSDISWFEWCTDLAAIGSKMPKVSKNIIRLHRYEAYLSWPLQVNWDNIDLLVTVGNSFVKQALINQVPDIEQKTVIAKIPNGVNLDKYRFVNKSPGKNIACIGYLNMRKNPMFLLQCMQKLHYIDPEYKLFLAGTFQDKMLEQYTKHMIKSLHLQDVVFFDNWQQDISAWLEDKHFIISTSIGESQGMGVLEAMACGLKPIVHNFPGADEIFSPQFLFNISEEFCSEITTGSYQSAEYRKFVEDNYSHTAQLEKINKIFTRLQLDIDSQQPAEQTPMQHPQLNRAPVEDLKTVVAGLSPAENDYSSLYF